MFDHVTAIKSDDLVTTSGSEHVFWGGMNDSLHGWNRRLSIALWKSKIKAALSLSSLQGVQFRSPDLVESIKSWQYHLFNNVIPARTWL